MYFLADSPYHRNITIATFAEFALYKQEAYAGSLSAGKILNDHGVAVAYKSDHAMEDTSAQYLLLQAAVAHSFGLPADKALRSVTSVPAAAIDMDNRVGYIRLGYDADMVVWDAHPLSVGATPKQVYIDGVATLDPAKVKENGARITVNQGVNMNNGVGEPVMRATISEKDREEVCVSSRKTGQAFVIAGISKSFLDEFPALLSTAGNDLTTDESLTLVVEEGEVTCLGTGSSCSSAVIQLHERRGKDNVVSVRLRNGHLSRGLTAVTSSLGMEEISTDPDTGDGETNIVNAKEAKITSNIDFAKYGVSLGGSAVKAKAFARARLGGVTRAIQPPITKGGLITGISTGMRTGLHSTLLNGGLFQEDVAMHVALGNDAKANEGTISMAIERLRALIKGGEKKTKEIEEGDAEGTWALIANGSMPLVIKADSNVSFTSLVFLEAFLLTVS